MFPRPWRSQGRGVPETTAFPRPWRSRDHGVPRAAAIRAAGRARCVASAWARRRTGRVVPDRTGRRACMSAGRGPVIRRVSSRRGLSEDDAGTEQTDDDQRNRSGYQTDAVGDGARRALRLVQRLEILRRHAAGRWRVRDGRRPPPGRGRIGARRPRVVGGPGRRRGLTPPGRLGGRIGALPVRVIVRDAGGGTHVHRRYNRRGTTAAPLSAYPRSRGHPG
jgi:hypothetical protein